MGDQADKNSGKGATAAGGATGNQHKIEFIDLLKSVLPSLPEKNLVALVEELRGPQGVYSEDDISCIDLNDLTLTSIRGAQLKKFRNYVQQVKDKQNPQPQLPQVTSRATLTTRKDGQTGTTEVTDSDVTIIARGSATGQQGGAEAHLTYGPGDTKLKNTRALVEAGKTTDNKQKMEFIVLLENQVLPTLPHENVVTLVEELQNSCGVFSESDLALVNLDDVVTLTSISGVQLKRFQDYVQQFQRQQIAPPPPDSMYL